MSDTKKDGLLNTNDVARELGITPFTVRKISPDRLPKINISGGEKPRWRWERNDVERFKQKNKVG